MPLPCRPRPRRGVDRHPLPSPGDDGLRHSGGAAGPRCCRFHPRTGGAGPAAHSAGSVLSDVHGRKHALCVPRPVRGAPAIARAFGPWLGGGLETAALDIVGASFVRDIEPGELLAIDADGVRSTRFANPTPKGCVFEYVYLARPDSTIAGRSVHAARVEIGRRLARECPVEADLVIGVPESGTPAAVGYAQESGVPYGQGLMKNAYVGRTFIQPSQTIRQLGIRLKLNPLKEVIRGKRLIVVDDSIVRGNTQRALVRMLREAGAVELHVRIASPPVKWPCFYGIDFPSPAELIANAVENEDEMLEAVRHAIGADTLGYISLRGMVAASEQPTSRLCTACFDGKYPIELPRETALGKNVIEHMLANVARGAALGELAADDEVPVGR